jgi:integrative and conjugative element protein (TIGR02256 family)
MALEDQGLLYLLPNDQGSLRIVPEVLAHLFAHRQHRLWRREAGGQLFAAIIENRIDVVEATGPRHSDRRCLFSYEPDRAAERAEIKERYERHLHFVGDWHTHRELRPTPSHTDLESMRDMVTQSDHELSGFVLVVVGTEQLPAGLHVSYHMRSNYFVLTPSSAEA